MQIIELTEEQFKNYASVHSKRNMYQSVEYANVHKKNGLPVSYLGLVDDDSNLIAATLIITYHLTRRYKFGYAPRGFLINFNDHKLVKIFTVELKKYYKKKKYVFIKVDPLITYKLWNSDDKLIKTEDGYFKYLYDLGYIHLGFNNYFEAKRARFNVILNTKDNNLNKTYNSFNRNAKRSIEASLKMGVNIHKGSNENIDLFYSIIKKKVKFPIEYYKDYIDYFNGNNNIELYFAKVDPKTYIDNYRFLLNKETKENKDITNKVSNKQSGNIDKLLQSKIDSDRLIENYNSEIARATEIYSKFPEGLVLGTCAIIKNDREVYFWIEGYEEQLKDINCSYLLRWEVMKKYINEGYKIFNLGEVTGNRNKENNKYYGIYFPKISFGADLYEYPGEFDLVIDKFAYRIYYNIMSFKEKRKKKK